MMRIPSILGTDDWLTVPFHGREKGIVDHIVDIITMTSSLLSQLDSLPSLCPTAASQLKFSILTQARALKARLDVAGSREERTVPWPERESLPVY
jgi:hypothetical protein